MDPNTPHWITVVRPYLELSYFFFSLLVPIVALIALRQIRIMRETSQQLSQQIYIMKKDSDDRADRAAKEKALEATFKFSEVFEDLLDELSKSSSSEIKAPRAYTSKVGDFSLDSLTSEDCDNAVIKTSHSPTLKLLVKVDAIAGMFISEVASEKAAFPIFAGAFCGFVKSHYDVITFVFCKSMSGQYKNIIQLYEKWSQRIAQNVPSREHKMNVEQIDEATDIGNLLTRGGRNVKTHSN